MSSAATSPGPNPPSFPIALTASRLGVHTTLLLFTALVLPRSTYVLTGTAPPEQASSRDKPQPQFLKPITAEPQWTMVWIVLGVGVVMGVWARWVEREMWGAREGGDDEAKVKRAALSRGQGRIKKSMKDALKGTLAASCIFHIVLVFFGAPLIDQFSKTYLLALLLSLLVIFTNAYIFKLPSFSEGTSALLLQKRLLWLRLFVEFSPRTPHERLLIYPVVGTLVGAWLGAYPIALDWDRPWQAWPLTPAYGAIIGYIVASWSALFVNALLFLAEVKVENRTGPMKSIQTVSSSSSTAVAAAAVKEKSKKSGRKKP